MNNTTKGYILGAISAASYGINPIAIMLYNDGFGVDSVLFYRYSFAIVFIGLIMVYKNISFKISLKEMKYLATIGLLFSSSSLALFESYKYIEVATASTILFVYPAMVAIILAIFFGEKINLTTLISIIMVIAGIFLLNGGQISSDTNIFGVIIVLISSLTYAIYLVIIQKSFLTKMPSLKISFYSLIFGITIYIVRIAYNNELTPLTTTREWFIISSLAIIPTLISLTALAKAIKYVGSTITAILGALEPITAVAIGIILFGERPSFLAYIGMAIIIVAVTIIIAKPNRLLIKKR